MIVLDRNILNSGKNLTSDDYPGSDEAVLDRGKTVVPSLQVKGKRNIITLHQLMVVCGVKVGV